MKGYQHMNEATTLQNSQKVSKSENEIEELRDTIGKKDFEIQEFAKTVNELKENLRILEMNNQQLEFKVNDLQVTNKTLEIVHDTMKENLQKLTQEKDILLE